MRPRANVLTEQELEIMKVVWGRERVTVRDVYETLLARRKVAYTTVMTMMRILEEKGYLVKSDAGKAYVYEAAEARERVEGGMVSEFLQRVFDGAAKPLLLHLVENKEVSAKEMEEIAAILKKGKKS
ncbi:MAG: BlaI/MecI/CopY family transcriptional regulator [Bryobacterales bacterium]|nr:BlaI/MecI/CopY family transcriptional regulator [Bryobacterales bacterium]